MEIFHCNANICQNFMFQIVKICLEYLCYDPNYNYDDDDEADDSMDTERLDDDDG